LIAAWIVAYWLGTFLVAARRSVAAAIESRTAIPNNTMRKPLIIVISNRYHG
jgi:hypothetical protein